MIYTTNKKSKYNIVKNPSKNECNMFRQFVRRAMQSFMYNYDTTFLQTIKVANDPYLFEYTQYKGYPIDKYSQELEELVLEANKQIVASGKFKAYKLDLYGNWSAGHIVILRNNKATSRTKTAAELYSTTKRIWKK